MGTVHFRLNDILSHYKKTPAALVEASGLAKTTVYNIVNDKAKAVELETLSKLVDGLERLTGKAITFNDLLEKEPRERNSLLDDLLKDAKPFDWEEMKKHIPNWTEEEKAENEAFIKILEEQREVDRKLDTERTKKLLDLFEEAKPTL